MSKAPPFTVAPAADLRLRGILMREEDVDIAFHIGAGETDGVREDESIHVCGHSKGSLDPDSFYEISDRRISIPADVLERLRGHELIMEQRPLAGGQLQWSLWMR